MSAVTHMNRRDFLRSGGLTIAVLSVPGWSSVFGQAVGAAAKPGESTLLRKSIDLARSRGVPLLVLRAPADAVLREQLGEMWGAYSSLANSSTLPDEDARIARMIDLALCELVCATDADILHELPPVSAMKDWADGIALVVEPVDARVTLVPGPVIFVPWLKEEPERTAGKLNLMSEVHARLHGAVAADLDMLRRRAHENFDALNAEQRDSLSKLGDDWNRDDWLAQAIRAPACIRLLVETQKDMRLRAEIGLRRAAQERLEGSISGSRWETAWWDRNTEAVATEPVGCTGGPCGMAFIPMPSVRFLRYFTETGRDVPPPAKK
jgi:hypothetical protein